MMTDDNWTFCGSNFAEYTNIELLCYTPEINMLYGNYTPTLKMKNTLPVSQEYGSNFICRGIY